jgi:preprotein translocase SecE subunit
VAQNRQRSRRRRSGATPTPEPTEHAFPDVEEARMAEAGPVADEGTPDTEPSALDQVAPGAPRVLMEHEVEPATGGNRVLRFLGHVVDELGRVQWPDRRQVFQSTLVVLLFVIIAGSYLGLLDAIWNPLIKAIL